MENRFLVDWEGIREAHDRGDGWVRARAAGPPARPTAPANTTGLPRGEPRRFLSQLIDRTYANPTRIPERNAPHPIGKILHFFR